MATRSSPASSTICSTVPDDEMNQPFREWKEALTVWNDRSEIEFRRLSFGDDDAFDFLDEENLEISVLGPFLTEKGNVSGLKFLGNPPKGPADRPRVALARRGRLQGVLGLAHDQRPLGRLPTPLRRFQLPVLRRPERRVQPHPGPQAPGRAKSISAPRSSRCRTTARRTSRARSSRWFRRSSASSPAATSRRRRSTSIRGRR